MVGEPVIRGFEERDRAALRGHFRRAGEGSPSAVLWGHEDSEAAVYPEPYMNLEPESLFPACNGGSMVGYLAGCLGSSRFPSESERFNQAIADYRLLFRPSATRFFARALADTVAAKARGEATAGDFVDPRWPAAGLMQRWFERLDTTGTPGCYAQTLAENTRAVRFFARMGFVHHGPALLVPGMRGGGQRLHQQTMVWTR